MGTPTVAVVPDPPRRADGTVELDGIVARLGPDTVTVLESARNVPYAGRWSWIVPHTGVRILANEWHATLITPTRTYRLPGDPLDGLDEVLSTLGLSLTSGARADLPPFTGGLVGGFAYDLARVIERLPTVAADDRGHPFIDLVVADTALGIDHESDELVVVHRPDLLTRLGATTDVDELRRRLREGPAGQDPSPAVAPAEITSTFTAGDYRKAVSTILDHVAAGDTFQVNVSQRLSAPWHGSAWQLYQRLRDHSPASHGVSHPAPWGGLASVSPETFLEVSGRDVLTRPIKGTRPRHRDAAVDHRLSAALVASPKDRAENVMVVDMERSDLGRVCETGSVHVAGLLELEQHPTVWHLVSTVTGQLRADVTPGQLLRATFPSGSVTGTPKVRAMEIIEHVEPVRRSFYCGAIGWFSAGTASLSVAIRTAELDHRLGLVDHGAGGGIVADSDPAAELAESIDKARAFELALGTNVTRE